MHRWWAWSTLVLAGACLVLGVLSLLDGDRLTGGLLVVLAVVLARDVRRRRVSADVTAEWPLERVRAVTSGHPDEVQAIRALRVADPRLGLADAVRLVRAGRAAPR